MKRIITKNKFKNKKFFDVNQNKSQKFIFFIINIYVDDIVLLSTLIYKKNLKIYKIYDLKITITFAIKYILLLSLKIELIKI